MASPRRGGEVRADGACELSCPLYPQKRTCAVHKLMSALGQKRTHAAHQKGLLFDQLVRACEQRRRHREAKGFGGFEIDDQLVLGRSLYRQVRSLLPFKNAVDITGSVPILDAFFWMSALGQ